MLLVVTGVGNVFYLAYSLIILLEKIFSILIFEALEQADDTLQILHVF